MPAHIYAFAPRSSHPDTLIDRSKAAANALQFEKLIKINEQMVSQLGRCPFFIRPVVTNCAYLLAGKQKHAEAAISFLVTAANLCRPDSRAEKNIALLYMMATKKIFSHQRRIAIHQQTSRKAITCSPLEKTAKQGYMDELRAAKRSVRRISIVPSLCLRKEGAS